MARSPAATAARKHPAVRKPRRPAWPVKFLSALAGGQSVEAAARHADVARSAVYARRQTDPGFAADWDAALEAGVESLEDEARRRAVDGVLRPVFHAGAKVGAVREFSDTLLIFLLKAKRPAVYRDSRHVTVAGDPAAPLKHEHVDPRTLTDADLAARIAALEAAAGPSADPAEEPA